MRAFLRSPEGCFLLRPHTTTIGRHEGADIVLQSAGVAEQHAALEFTASDGSFTLQDLNSLHGTFVNGCQVQNAAVKVKPGDILRFGTCGAPFELVVDGGAQREKLQQGEKEMGHLPGLEAEAKQKDAVIRDLQEEIAAMAKTLAQAAVRNEVELTQKLHTFDQELGAKTEEIKALREQVSNLQKGSSQVFSHSLYERDLEIGRLRKESEKAKRDHALAAGLVSSLQREIEGKEQKMQQLRQDIDRMKKESREKDNQLAVVSAKVNIPDEGLSKLWSHCARIKEETQRELGEREAMACQKRIGELERDLEGLWEEAQKHHAEQESTRKQLAEHAKAAEELRAAGARQALQLQEMGRRERLLRADAARAKEQLESFKTQVMRACSLAAAGSAGKAITEQQVVEKVRQISEESQQSREREKCLQEELSSRLSKEKEVSENVEVFTKSLCELQMCLRSSCSSASLRGELERLEALGLGPVVAAIVAVVVETLRMVLSWLEDAEQLLASAGMDLDTSSKGLLAALRKLLENSKETAQRNQILQAQLERLQESQAALLQEHVKELEAKQEQVLQIKIQQIILEKDKETKEWAVDSQILERAVAEEKDKWEQSMEEENRKIEELESHLRSMTEAMEMKAKEQEVTDGKLREAMQSLEEAAMREMTLQQQVLLRDEQLGALQEENELQRRKLQEEIAEYKEQSKQHSLTIVALEEKLVEAKQQQKTLEEERAALLAELEGFRGDALKSTSGAQPEASPVTEPHCCLRKFREKLAAAQSVLLSKEAIIAGLTKELAETRARMSDMRGELSEEQKVELERNQSRVKCQERDLSLLREKLSQMSSLVQEKDQALKAAAEELRQAQADCQALRADATRETVEKPEDAPEVPAPAGKASERDPMLDLANLGMKCRGLRHEETIQRQKEGLAELRERIKMLEKKQPSAVLKKSLEPLVVLAKDLPEKIVQKMGLEKEPAPELGTKLQAGKVLGHVTNRGLHGATGGAASLEMADVMDLGEKMYLDVVGALGSLMEVKELSGVQSLRHLPLEEREKAAMQRQKDLELLYKKIRSLKSRLERKEEMLREYETSMEQLRLNQVSLQRCQEEMSKLEDEAYREAEEKALLREALERTQLQLSQERRLLQASKPHQPAAKKPLSSGKPKAKGRAAEACKTGST
ncbi:PREDICTED: forkhead-associated domain-containing protein 1 [Mesitornis unicolor]|uniref:forkhead-associated domain-containing protein 1 n=1 Tax=Mesitornis unicolor TaxID=54374 RepID=UPI0005293A0F|nr:PREDICTED: forkhead-associated domain-containing protein 1 [Mesitornis unicolor]